MTVVTDRQAEMLAFIGRNLRVEVRFPTLDDIAQGAGLAGKSGVSYHFAQLQAAGLIERDASGWYFTAAGERAAGIRIEPCATCGADVCAKGGA